MIKRLITDNLGLWLLSVDPLNTGLQTVPANNATIPTFYDKNGNALNATQGVAAQQPLLITNQLNGQPIIRFDASNDVISTNFNINPASNPNVTIFCLYKIRTSTGNQGLFGVDNGGFDRLALSSGSFGAGVGNGVGVTAVPALATLNTFQLMTLKYQSGVSSGSSVNFNGGVTPVVFTDATGAGTASTAIGGINTTQFFSSLDLAAFMIYTTILSAPRTLYVQQFLASIFGSTFAL